MLQGRLNKQIASDLGIHERTVKVHRKAIMTKLGVRSGRRAHAADAGGGRADLRRRSTCP